MAKFAEEKSKGIEAAKKYGKYYAEQEQIYQNTYNDYAVKKTELLKEAVDIGEELISNELIHKDHLTYLPKLVTYLKSGRADDLKEALNLAITEEREELERAQRMQEEARRTAMLERQMLEERRHNEAMEHQAAMQVQYMKDQADQQARAQAKAESAAWREQAEAQNKALKRCHKCENYKACGKGIPNCGSFRAKSIYR